MIKGTINNSYISKSVCEEKLKIMNLCPLMLMRGKHADGCMDGCYLLIATLQQIAKQVFRLTVLFHRSPSLKRWNWGNNEQADSHRSVNTEGHPGSPQKHNLSFIHLFHFRVRFNSTLHTVLRIQPFSRQSWSTDVLSRIAELRLFSVH